MTFAAWFPRLAAVFAAFIVGKATELGITLDPEEITAMMLLVYAGAHRVISKSVNPGDAIKSSVVNKDKATVKATE